MSGRILHCKPSIAGANYFYMKRLRVLVAPLACAPAACEHAPREPVVAATPREEHARIRGVHRRDASAARPAFYSKSLACRGVPVRAHRDVRDEALVVACERLQRLLRHARPEVARNLAAARVEVHVIGERQVLSDLPEHRHMRGVRGGYGRADAARPTVDVYRGMLHGVSVACGEENLLRQGPGHAPTHNAKELCVHEMAHAVMNFGLDADARARIEAQWRAATREPPPAAERADGDVASAEEDASAPRAPARPRPLWRRADGSKAYAATNSSEYFAELTMWYFGGHGEFVNTREIAARARAVAARGDDLAAEDDEAAPTPTPPPGPGGLLEYDEGGFRLLASIYGGTGPPVAARAAHAARLRPLQLAAERGGGGGEERRAFFSAADAAAAAATVARERFAGGALRSTNGPPANKRVSVEFRFGGALADAPAIDGRARDAEGAAGEEDEEEDEEYEVSWVDYDGRKRWGFRLSAALPVFTQQTYAGHVWLVERLGRDEDARAPRGDARAAAAAPSPPREIVQAFVVGESDAFALVGSVADAIDVDAAAADLSGEGERGVS